MDPKHVRFDYFYEEESEQFAFYRIPKALFTDEMFVSLSTDAKLLYGLMLDRMSLSRRNQWIDENGHVYIVFTVDEIIEYLNCGKDKAIKIMAELDEEKGIGLIQKVRHGMGKPAQIYVKNFTSGYIYAKGYDEESFSSRKNRLQEVGKTDLKKSEKPTSRSLEIRPMEVGKTDSNNINFIHTEITDTNFIHPSSEGGWIEWERTIKENIGYEYLIDGYQVPEDLLDMTLLFKSMTKEQVGAYLKISEEEALKVMKAFGRMRRGYFDEGRECIAVSKTHVEMASRVLVVYLDFLNHGMVAAPFASADPFVGCLFIDSVEEILYEIIHIPYGEEEMANQLLSNRHMEKEDFFKEKRRVVVLDSIEQWERIHLKQVFSYCVVKENGEVSYYG